MLAKTTTDSQQKEEYYELLGAAHDPALANQALALALTDEAPVTVRPSIINFDRWLLSGRSGRFRCSA